MNSNTPIPGSGQLRAGDRFWVANPGLQQQLGAMQQQLAHIINQLDTVNARAALAEAREFNSKIPTRRKVVDYLPIPKLIAGHPNVQLPPIQNLNMQAEYGIGDLPPPNLLPRNDAAYTELKAAHQNLATLRTRVRRIMWFYHDPVLGPMLNDAATRDECRGFLDTLKEYIKS
ncbi:hypothetical protein CASFOL_033185 [Castilleja foliolosa]|uniref:Uncharacterized protein n=1 Tax=Castilleja foliolosa TaxID=1961234 RepID=A0ABD3C511_9LAMI